MLAKIAPNSQKGGPKWQWYLLCQEIVGTDFLVETMLLRHCQSKNQNYDERKKRIEPDRYMCAGD